MNPLTIADAISAAAQILALVQNAQANGKAEISRADFDAAVGARNTALEQLDADIAAQTGSTPVAPAT